MMFNIETRILKMPPKKRLRGLTRGWPRNIIQT